MRLIDRTDSFPGALHEARAASAAGGGTALTTAATLVTLPDNATHVSLLPRNFVTGVVCQFALNPYLLILKTLNSLASVTDYSAVAQDNNVATVVSLNALPTSVNGGYVYVGSHLPFRGLRVAAPSAANAIASVLSGQYWNGTWNALVLTDGTAAAGATCAQAGDVTWTLPTDWLAAPLSVSGPTSLSGYAIPSYFWVRLTVSAALSATVSLPSILALNRSTLYAEIEAGAAFQFRTMKGPGGVACLELAMNAGTGNAVVNAFTFPGGAF